MGYKFIVLAAVALLLSTNINASIIVDTGTGPIGVLLPGYSLDGSQHLAGKFTTSNDYTIDSIEGWISYSGINTFGTIAIYSDVGGLPGAELYSSIFEGAGNNAQWLGVSGIALDLTAGTYWAAFEVRPEQTMSAAMPYPVTSPLSAYAYYPVYDGTWFDGGALDFGVRISTIPVPAAVWLFGSGLISLIGLARKKVNV